MAREELETLTQEELIDLILKQAAQLAKLQADYEALRLKFERNCKPPTLSKNSSQPPSTDQKGNQPKDRRKRRHGPPVGHEKHERKFVAQADQVVNVRPQSCHTCQTDLSAEGGCLVKVSQITELPAASAQVIEVRQYAVVCPDCQQVQVEAPPAGLEMERTFGARLEATVVYYRQEQHMSYARTQKALFALSGAEISQGGIDEIMKRAGRGALQKEGTLQERVCRSKVIHCDETSCRVDGDNWWEWVFWTASTVLHVIRFNRSLDVIHAVMGQSVAEVWVSDCWSSQLKAPARQCLFVFLYRPDVEPTHNVAERALRPSVIHRKVTGGFRSGWGAKAYAALASVIDTAELAGMSAFDAILSLFGPPALPIPAGSE